MSERFGGMRAGVLSGLLGVLAALALLAAIAFPPVAHANEAVVEDGGTIDIVLSANVGPVKTNDVTVEVLDESGAPVLGALVTLEGAGDAYTKADGTVVLAQLEVGKRFALTVTKAGYQAFSSSFACEGVTDEVWRVTLVAEGGQPDPDDPDDPGATDGPAAGSGPGSGWGSSGGSASWLHGANLSVSTGDALWLAVAMAALACCAASVLLALSWACRIRAEGGRRG